MPRRRTIARAAALSAALVLLMVQDAGAVGFVTETDMTIQASPALQVEQGTRVTISGRLGSDRAFCRRSSIVTLRAYGESNGQPFTGGRVNAKTTSAGGAYAFSVRITEQVRYRVWFRGKVGGVHPDIKACRKSRSATVTFTLD